MSVSNISLLFLLLHAYVFSRSLTLLIREVLAGSVFLPSMDYLADPVSVSGNKTCFYDGQIHGSYKNQCSLVLF